MKFVDRQSVFYDTRRQLAKDADLQKRILGILGELEDDNCWHQHQFPMSKLHKIDVWKKYVVYRVDITKVSGWRWHLREESSTLYLCEVLPPNMHDDVIKILKTHQDRYTIS